MQQSPKRPSIAAPRVGSSQAICIPFPPLTRSPAEEAGTAVAVATINDRDEARRFLALGAHGVMTDDPTLLGTDHDEGQTARAAASSE